MTTTEKRLRVAHNDYRLSDGYLKHGHFPECRHQHAPIDSCLCEERHAFEAGYAAALEDLQRAEEKLAKYESGAHVMVPEDQLVALVEALQFYADSGTYHAIGFLPDRPCGLFAEDFSIDEHGDYDYEKPGKRAREVLAMLTTAQQQEKE